MHCPMSTLPQLSPKPLVFLGARIILVIFQEPLFCQLPLFKDISLNYMICFEIPGKLFSLLCLYRAHLQLYYIILYYIILYYIMLYYIILYYIRSIHAGGRGGVERDGQAGGRALPQAGGGWQGAHRPVRGVVVVVVCSMDECGWMGE